MTRKYWKLILFIALFVSLSNTPSAPINAILNPSFIGEFSGRTVAYFCIILVIAKVCEQLYKQFVTKED